MNTLIRELAEQAGITTNLDTDLFNRDANLWVNHFSKEFAQLIIQECVNAVNDTPLFYRDYRNQIEESMRNACAWNIKDKFGVNDEE